VKGINIRNIPMIPIPMGTILNISDNIEIVIPAKMKMSPRKITKSLAWLGITILSD